MRSLNSPTVLNALEAKIAESVPADAKHILVVNAGDGRLPRAILAKAPKAAASVVTVHPRLEKHVDDFSGRSSDPWDLAWHTAQVGKHGAYDYVVFYQLQEFWRGELYQLERVIGLAAPGATVWTSFVNAQSYRMISRFLPPVRLGFSTMADPLRSSTNLDFGSYLDFAGRQGAAITELWGMLDQNAQEYCQKPPAQPAKWELRGVKASVASMADAFLWGASVVAAAMRLPGGEPAPASPKVSYSAYNSNLLQALLLPYPDEQGREGTLGAAMVELKAWRKSPGDKVGPIAKLFINQVGEIDKPKRVLLLGCGWGRDLLLLKRNYPAWDWVGFDHNRDLVALGQDLVAAAGATSVSAEMGEPLPFDDRSFDLVVSLGYYGALYESAARFVAKEVRRVAKGAIYHLEDGRGPDHGLQLKSYSLKAVYSGIGVESSVKPVLVDSAPNGMYMLSATVPV